jgi:NAD(P)-dependent dehydrogenase (short-subunit alcohol dehydrogenase family)
VLIIGRGSGIARAIAMAVSEDGGRVIVANQHPDELAAAYRGMDMGIEAANTSSRRMGLHASFFATDTPRAAWQPGAE